MTRIIAHIKLFKGSHKRQAPFTSGYRPICDVFGKDKLTSGQITLIGKEWLSPGEECEVEIRFINAHESKDIEVGKAFHFFESPKEFLGEGIVKEIIEF